MGKKIILTYEEICNLWEDYYKKHGKYPRWCDCRRHNGLPDKMVIQQNLGNRFNEFNEKYGMYKNLRYKSYEEYCNIFKEICFKLGRSLTLNEINNDKKYKEVLPTMVYFIHNCPDKKVKTFNQFLEYLKLENLPKKTNYGTSKEYVINAIKKKIEELDRPIQVRDFKNLKQGEIGIKLINKHWGTFNNMLKELGIPINQEDRLSQRKTIEQMKQDIIKLCNYIKETESRVNIYYEDIDECEWCSHSETYNKCFKKELGMTLGEFIVSIDFKTGFMGDSFLFGDESIKSKYEYLASNYLRQNNIYYERDKLYKDFTVHYKGKMNCDYFIIYNGIPWYVEVAGMLYSEDSVVNSNKISKSYNKKLQIKKWLLKYNDINYKILYAQDFRKPLNEVFSFLDTKDTYCERVV